MVKKAVTIQQKDGWGERKIAMLMQKASQFSSQVHIEVGNQAMNAKSIMGMMSLKVHNGDEIIVIAEGTDEEAAVSEIESYLSEQ